MKHSTTRRMNEQRSKKQWNFGSTIQSEEKNRLCEWRKWNSTKNIKANDISNISDEKKFNQFSTVLRCAALQRPVYYMKCIFNSVSWSMDFLCGAFFCFCSYPLALNSYFFTAVELWRRPCREKLSYTLNNSIESRFSNGIFDKKKKLQLNTSNMIDEKRRLVIS